ncbi:MAG: hypothetical protein J6Y48_02580 [Clostridia bacterium]|nr:hypothetical protein [Clostridia bacterium]
MGTITGSLDGVHNLLTFGTPVSLGVSCPANYYPNGSVTFDNIGPSGAYWKNTILNAAKSIHMYLCDSAGNNRVSLFTVSLSANGSNTTIKRATISGATGLTGKALYLIATGDTNDIILNRTTTVTINTTSAAFTITLGSSAGGTLTANKTSAAPGTTIKLTPTANTGYQFDGYTTVPASLEITNNRFTMPSRNVTVTASFVKKNYTITLKTNPADTGTVSASPNPATYGDTVTLTQSPGIYYFNGWTTSPAVTITNRKFTMPASNVTVTANYLIRSGVSVDKVTFKGGDTVTMTIRLSSTGPSSTYTHRYRMQFEEGMDTGWVDVAAGVTSVAISIPASWSNYIPNDVSAGPGTLALETYNGNTLIGTHHQYGLIYQVPESAVPLIANVAVSGARTIGGVTYANIGDIYTQNKSGVRVQAEAEAQAGASIASMSVSIAGYSGSAYNTTEADDEIDFTSGLLTISGSTVITVTATDTRGRTSTATETITVLAYSPPFGTLEVHRVDALGDPDDLGEYGGYSMTKTYSAIGSNTLTVSMTSQGSTETLSLDSGNILPVTRQTFSVQQEYLIQVTLQDAFETVVITARLRSAKFIIHVNAAGDKLGFMKAANKTIPTGKNATIEFSGDAQIYIGDDTLEDYITAIVNSLIS